MTVTFFCACSDNFLDTIPAGVNSPPVMANRKGLNSVLMGAWAAIDGAGLNNGGWHGTRAWAGSVSSH